jgi:hypothetical protein
MIQRYLGTTVFGMWCKYVDTKSLPYNTLSRYHIKNRRTYGLTLSPYRIKKTTDQGDAPIFLLCIRSRSEPLVPCRRHRQQSSNIKFMFWCYCREA